MAISQSADPRGGRRGRGNDRGTRQGLADEILRRSEGSTIQKPKTDTRQLWKPTEVGDVYNPEKGRRRAAQQQALMSQGAQLVQAQQGIESGLESARQEGRQAGRQEGAQATGGSYSGGSQEVAAQAARDAGFEGQDLVEILAVAGRESGFQPDAHRTDRDPSSGSGDRGLWQINYIWDDELRNAGIINDWTDLFDPATNARAAKHIHNTQGWDAWGYSQGSWGGGSHVTGTDRDQSRGVLQKLGIRV